MTIKNLQKLTGSQENGDAYGEAAKVLVNLLKAGEMEKFNDKYGRFETNKVENKLFRKSILSWRYLAVEHLIRQ